MNLKIVTAQEQPFDPSGHLHPPAPYLEVSNLPSPQLLMQFPFDPWGAPIFAIVHIGKYTLFNFVLTFH